MRVELPPAREGEDAAWVEISGPDELRNGDRKAVNKATSIHLDENGQPVIPGSLYDDRRDALLRRIILSWSFPSSVPSVDPEALDRLTIEQGDALNEAVKPHMKLIDGDENPSKRGTDPTEG